MDELGLEDRVACNPMKLTVEGEGIKPFHFPVATEMSANFKPEAQRMIQLMLKSWIIEEVKEPSKWCAWGYFVEKPGKDAKLRLVTDFHQLNDPVKHLDWPFYSSDAIRR